MTTGLTLSARCMHFVRTVQNVGVDNGYSAASSADRDDTVARKRYEGSRGTYVEQ